MHESREPSRSLYATKRHIFSERANKLLIWTTRSRLPAHIFSRQIIFIRTQMMVLYSSACGNWDSAWWLRPFLKTVDVGEMFAVSFWREKYAVRRTRSQLIFKSQLRFEGASRTATQQSHWTVLNLEGYAGRVNASYARTVVQECRTILPIPWLTALVNLLTKESFGMECSQRRNIVVVNRKLS